MHRVILGENVGETPGEIHEGISGGNSAETSGEIYIRFSGAFFARFSGWIPEKSLTHSWIFFNGIYSEIS